MEHTLTRKGDYTVRAVLSLARHHVGERRKARQIASEMDVPLAYLRQILANLVQYEVLRSVAGPDGGYELCESPDQITLLRVIELAEGPIEARACALSGGPCDWETVCPLHETWARGTELLRQHLAGTTFSELAEVGRSIETGHYEWPSDIPPHAVTVIRRGLRDEDQGEQGLLADSPDSAAGAAPSVE